MKLRYRDVKDKATEFLALTSLTVSEFDKLVPEFEAAFQAYMSQAAVEQSACYSGKKKGHTVKNLLITDRSHPIRYLRETFAGSE